MIKKFMVLLVFISFSLFSHPKKLSSIKGEQIKLHTIGHSFAGVIKDRMVLGLKKPGSFISELKIIENDQETVSSFKPFAGKKFSGELVLLKEQARVKHKIEFLELIKKENIYRLKFDEETVDVFVKADDFRSGHFINPEYTMTYRGEEFSFKLQGGEACYGYSLHLITMIMAARVF